MAFKLGATVIYRDFDGDDNLAFITRIDEQDDDATCLVVFPPNKLMYTLRGVQQSAAGAPNSWCGVGDD